MPDVYAKQQISLLEQQFDLYNALNELSKHKEKALAMASVAELDKIISAEQALILKIAQAEKRRLASQQDLAEAWEIPFEQLTMSFISEHAGDEIKEGFQQITDELAALLVELKRRNDHCQNIISGALRLVQKRMNPDGNTMQLSLVDRRI